MRFVIPLSLAVPLLSFARAQLVPQSPCILDQRSTLDNWRTVNVQGDVRSYFVSTLSYNKNGDESSAECVNVASFATDQVLFDRQTYYSAPCQANVTNHDQVLSVDCIGDNTSKGWARVHFYQNGSTAIFTVGCMSARLNDGIPSSFRVSRFS
jgi:hypothetical protein